MADISNKLNKASEDLAGTFVEIKENTTDFGVALTEATSKMADFTEQYVKAVDGLGDKTKGIAETLKQIFSKAGGAFKKIPGLTKLAALGPLGAITGAATLLFKQLLQVSDTIAQISKDTGLIGKQLKGLFKETKLAAGGLHAFGMSLQDVGKQAAAIHEAMGGTANVSSKLIDITSRIQKAMGGSAQEAANLATNLIRGFGKTEKQVEAFANNMMSFATTHGINARKVMRDISNDSNLTSIYLSRGEDYLQKSVLLAAKMGKSLADMTATTDAFSNIESAVEITGRLNQAFGGNLNAMKMYNMYVKQDVIGTQKELNKLFSTPRGIQVLEEMPGHAKELGALVGLTVDQMRTLPAIIAANEKALRGPTKEQVKLNDFIKAGMTLWEQLRGIVASVLLPLFTALGELINDQIKPLMNEATKMARAFGKAISESMAGAEGLGPKLKAALTTIMEKVGPFLDQLGHRIGIAIRGGLLSGVGNFFAQLLPKNPLDIFNNIVQAGHQINEATGLNRILYNNATGQVHSRPTLALVGEENRSEVVVPTERIRKGLPVSGSVARELSSIGVPGFANGLGGSGPSAATVATYGGAQRRRARENMLYGSQGDPNAIKRREQQIEQQAAEDRAAQRVLVNDIMKEQRNLAEAEYFHDEKLGGDETGTRPPGSPKGKGPGRDWAKTIHNLAKGLDRFMKLTNTSWKDIWQTMPDRWQKPIDKFYAKLPDQFKRGLSAGTKEAWDHYLKTGKIEQAFVRGLAVGIKQGVAGEGEFQTAIGNVLAASIEGKSWRKALGEEFTASLNNPEGLLGSEFQKLNNTSIEIGKEADKQNKLTKDLVNEFTNTSNQLHEQANDLEIWLGPDNPQVMELRAGAAEAGDLAKQFEKDNRKTQLKLGAKQALASGGAAALQSGVDTFAQTGSFKEAGKSALASGVGAGVSAGATLALTPYLGPAAPLVGGMLGSLAEFGVSKLFGKKKPTHGSAARAKVVGGLSGAIRLAKRPGGEQLYEAFKIGSSGNEMAKKFVDAAMLNSEGQPDEGLRQELVNAVGAVIERTSGTRFSSNEILGLLSGIKGAGMQNHEQKSLLTSYERRVEGAGARGAVVNRPTVALIGEAGPEVLTPLDQTPGNAPLGSSGGDLAAEIRQMNSLLRQVITNPPPVNLDGQRVSKVLNSVNSDDIRTGVSTVNSRF